MSLRFLRIFEDTEGAFHYQAYAPSTKGARATSMLCGLGVIEDDLREVAWFRVNDGRGRVHYERGCEACRDELVV